MINLQNIINNEFTIHFLNIEETVITDQIKWIIKNLFTKKTADSDNVSNKILKIIYKAIKKNLMMMFTQCFTNNLLSSCLKKFTTIILHKKKKKNYSLSDNYHLIILENTIIKLFKKIVTEHITNIAEKHDLLIWN